MEKKIYIRSYFLLSVFMFCAFLNNTSDAKEIFKNSLNAKRPDFSLFKDVKKKKKAFFDYMYPHIKQVNTEVLALRKKVKSISLKPKMSNKDLEFIVNLCPDYLKKCEDLSPTKMSKKLLSRIDIVPPSLVLAQAANESAWGTSRFALKGNNYFGQWCYKKGCGLVPLSRNVGTKHEVRKFKSPLGSVKGYVQNINSGRVYESLRIIRSSMRAKGGIIFGAPLAIGLKNYSERREAYVKEISQLIKSNKLKDYDLKFWNDLQVGK